MKRTLYLQCVWYTWSQQAAQPCHTCSLLRIMSTATLAVGNLKVCSALLSRLVTWYAAVLPISHVPREQLDCHHKCNNLGNIMRVYVRYHCTHTNYARTIAHRRTLRTYKGIRWGHEGKTYECFRNNGNMVHAHAITCIAHRGRVSCSFVR